MPTDAADVCGARPTDRNLLRANRAAGARNGRHGQIDNSAARPSCGDVSPGLSYRLDPPNLSPKITKFGNQPGHFLDALKQGLFTTTHKRYPNKTTKSAVHDVHALR